MSLDSIEYLVFLPLAFLLYWAVPDRKNTVRNCVLILVSYAFYAFADLRFCGLLALMTVTTYLAGRMMHVFCHGKYAKVLAAANVSFCLAVLCAFKYLGFFVAQVSSLLGVGGG